MKMDDGSCSQPQKVYFLRSIKGNTRWGLKNGSYNYQRKITTICGIVCYCMVLLYGYIYALIDKKENHKNTWEKNILRHCLPKKN